MHQLPQFPNSPCALFMRLVMAGSLGANKASLRRPAIVRLCLLLYPFERRVPPRPKGLERYHRCLKNPTKSPFCPLPFHPLLSFPISFLLALPDIRPIVSAIKPDTTPSSRGALLS